LNWIEIDKILYGIIARHDVVEDMFEEAEKQFKWNRSQSQAAIIPLLKHNTNRVKLVKNPRKRSTKRK